MTASHEAHLANESAMPANLLPANPTWAGVYAMRVGACLVNFAMS